MKKAREPSGVASGKAAGNSPAGRGRGECAGGAGAARVGSGDARRTRTRPAEAAPQVELAGARRGEEDLLAARGDRVQSGDGERFGGVAGFVEGPPIFSVFGFVPFIGTAEGAGRRRFSPFARRQHTDQGDVSRRAR